MAQIGQIGEAPAIVGASAGGNFDKGRPADLILPRSTLKDKPDGTGELVRFRVNGYGAGRNSLLPEFDNRPRALYTARVFQIY